MTYQRNYTSGIEIIQLQNTLHKCKVYHINFKLCSKLCSCHYINVHNYRQNACINITIKAMPIILIKIILLISILILNTVMYANGEVQLIDTMHHMLIKPPPTIWQFIRLWIHRMYNANDQAVLLRGTVLFLCIYLQCSQNHTIACRGIYTEYSVLMVDMR